MNEVEIDRLLEEAEELEGEIAALDFEPSPTIEQARIRAILQARLNNIRAKLLAMTGSGEVKQPA